MSYLNINPFIIAEMSGNHNQSLEKALKMVEAVAEAGANAIKLQTYTADTMTLNISQGEFFIADENHIEGGNSLYDLYKLAYTPWDWHETLFKKARELDLVAFSAPFDETAVDFLETLNCPLYKIASPENTDWPLLKKVAQTKKPVIMSTGMSTLSEIYDSLDILKTNGCEDITLLKCTSTYPTDPKDSNILTIPNMIETFKCKIGLSDHTLGIGVAIGAVALGATVIEKHFTLNHSDGGVDSTFSLEPNELQSLVEECRRVYLARGKVSYNILNAEKIPRQYKRSIYVVEDIKKGEIFTKKNLRRIRPGLGLEPKYYERMLGKKVKCDIKRGTALTWDII